MNEALRARLRADALRLTALTGSPKKLETTLRARLRAGALRLTALTGLRRAVGEYEEPCVKEVLDNSRRV